MEMVLQEEDSQQIEELPTKEGVRPGFDNEETLGEIAVDLTSAKESGGTGPRSTAIFCTKGRNRWGCAGW